MAFTIQEFNATFSKDIRQTFDNQAREAVKNVAFSRWMSVADSTEYTASYTSTEGMTLPEELTEQQNLPTSNLGKWYKSTQTATEYGHNIIVTFKSRLKMKDNTEDIARHLNTLKNAAIISCHIKLEKLTHGLLNDAFAGATYLAPDGLSICNDAHTWNSTGNTYDNKLSAGTAPAVSVLDSVEAYGGAFTDAEGNEMPLNFNTIVCKKGWSAAQKWKQILGFNNGQYSPTSIANINIYVGEYRLIETPYLTSSTAYFFLADLDGVVDSNGNSLNPMYLDFIQRPQIMSDAQQKDNLDFVYPYAFSCRFGVRNAPFSVLGDPGA